MSLKPVRGASSRRRQLLGLPRRVPTRRFIPDGDSDFANKARCFALKINEDPARYHLSVDDAQRIDRAVQAFRDALAKSYNRITRSMEKTAVKEQTRAEAVRVVRKYGTLIRLNEQIPSSDKIAVGVFERRKPVRRVTQGTLPAPVVRFIGTSGEGELLGHKHVLEFYDHCEGLRRNRPQGAVRLELFVELVEPDAPIPQWPGELSGGRGWYVRSYTRSPIHVEFPVAKQQAMRVVYWARWADAKGNVGSFCATVKARVEGWDGGGRAVAGLIEGQQRQQRIVITSAMKELPDYSAADEGDEASDVDATRMLPADAA